MVGQTQHSGLSGNNRKALHLASEQSFLSSRDLTRIQLNNPNSKEYIYRKDALFFCVFKRQGHIVTQDETAPRAENPTSF